MDVTDCVSSSGSLEYYENRLRTFDTYPEQMLLDKFQLTRAGLYYTGKSDICQCFRCHIKKSSMKRDDDAIKEHIKWSSNCEYMKMVGAPPPSQTSATPLAGFGMRSSNLMKPVDPKVFQTWREPRNDAM